MSKRRPGAQLTQDNWDDEDEEVEAGTFKPASAEELKGRQIKKAKRRGVISDTGDGGEGSAFKAFSGFGGFGAATGGAKPTFAFNMGGASANKSDTSATTPGFSFNSGGASTTNGTKPNDTASKSETANKRGKYLASLKSLNESVTKWIQTHVDRNPHCILTPIFRDYEAHLAKLEKIDPEKGDSQQVPGAKVESNGSKEQDNKAEAKDKTSSATDDKSSSDQPKAADKPAAATAGGFSFSTAASTNSSTAAGGFTFGGSAGTSSNTGATGIFGMASSGGAASSTSGFSFGAVSKPAADAAKSNEDEEYVPPKEEVKTVVEEDAFYTKRCKLFVKRDEQWKDKGIGNIHLKEREDKTQLLIRADTNLGNILLNIKLQKSLPATRSGKNNVLIVCVPNPPLDEKNPDDRTAVSMLIRVKTAEDADELLEKINEAKNKAS